MVVPTKQEPKIHTDPVPFERFDVYGKANPKYNLFSALDHPVNHWSDYGTCGSVPEN